MRYLPITTENPFSGLHWAKRKIKLSAALLSVLLLACGEGQPNAVLELYVLNSFGDGVANAEVAIFRTREDWLNETNPVKPPKKTAQNGVVRFVGLEPGEYYINAVADSLNNWEGKFRTVVKSIGSFYVNTEFTVINKNNSSLLAGPGGKRWRITEVTLNAQPFPTGVPACVRDNLNIFFKSNKFIRDEGPTKCSPTDPQRLEGTWRFNPTGTDLIFDFGNEVEVWKIIDISRNLLRFQLTFGAAVVVVSLRPVE
ncbi:MAG: hypothetical protein RMJ44_03660 [Cytophagales bacterium]|nr:hypothetical protein [Bernardetiaceae bacterium]MDW8210161.1 hypothetical protein [Cytophagales bacterium]